VDTPVPGWRTADLNTGYLPFLEGKGIAQYTSDPVFLELAEKMTVERQPGQKVSLTLVAALLKMHRAIPGSYFRNLKEKRALKWIRTFSESFPHPFLNWSHVESLRSWTSLPIIIKGIQNPTDACKALELGVEGVYVSNHGGRQIDGAIGSFSALKEVRKGIKNDDSLIFDSGIRSGADVFKALSAGAQAVGVGRPYVCGLALGGVKGVVHVFESIRAELEATMMLTGAASVKDVRKGNFCTY
jgi:isopentenyl diphosphate isomerase/L-lactate dehydrogenase-like FMN-dependent dehydrogenase